MITHFRFCAWGTAVFMSFIAVTALAESGSASIYDEGGANAACIEHTQATHSGKGMNERLAAIRNEMLAYQKLTEQALSLRAQAIRLRQDLRDKIDRNISLSGQDLLDLNQGAAKMLEVREALLQVSNEHECWLDIPVSAEADEAYIQSAGIAISLSAALVLYDNYISAISLYRSDTVLRRHLNRADKGFEIRDGQLTRIAMSFASPANSIRVRRALKWFEQHGLAEVPENDEYRYVTQLIEQSPARQIVRKLRPLSLVGSAAGFLSVMTFDTLLGLKDEGVFVPSLLFGNAVGLVESRRGKLDERPDVLQRVQTTVQAGDILLEKTPFRLTDAFIPGHWGHVAMWVGNESELRELGIWNHPVVRRYQRQIGEGKAVVEALRSGVEMNTLTNFLNVDDTAVLRQNDLSPAQRAEVVIQALRQVGKAYDFNFDVESTDKIVCSELVYHAYTHIKWPTVKHVGRATISPDNVAVRSLGDGPLSVALLYHDGSEVSDNQGGVMASLVLKPKTRALREDRMIEPRITH